MTFRKLDSILPKKVLSVALAILIIAPALLAQVQMEDVVYLKDGSIVRGQVIEQIPNVSVKIQTKDGSVFVYKMEEILKITREPLKVTPLETKEEKTNGYAEGKADGERDGRGNFLWFLAGFGCGIFGVGAAYLIKPSPPASALMGKSPEYVMGYTEGYQERSKTNNCLWASAGWLTWVVIYLVAIMPASEY